MAQMTNGGVRLLGLDVPSKVEDQKLKVYAAVEGEGMAAPPAVALIIRNRSPTGQIRAAKVVKELPFDGSATVAGISVPLTEAGMHFLEVSICSSDATGTVGPCLFQSEFDNVECVVEQPRGPLPKLDQKDSLVLCGVDIPEVVSEGKMRVFIALKRTWHDAPKEVALIVRDQLPSGERRAAKVCRSLGEEAEAIGIEVPMGEAGRHQITVQVAKFVNGEMIEVFHIGDRSVEVVNPPPVVMAENAGIQLCGVDVPKQVEGTMRAIISVQRSCTDAPRELALIARNVLPDGSRRGAVIKKVIDSLEAQTIGMEIPLCEAGEHSIEFSLGEVTAEGLVELINIPSRTVLATNPPMPRIAESEKDSVVLCGIDVNGARFPHLKADIVRNGSLRVIMALARTWETAPRNYALMVRDLAGRCAMVRKEICTEEPTTIGLTVPMTEEGVHNIQVTVAVVEENGEIRPLFGLPAVPVVVEAPAKPAMVEEDVASAMETEEAAESETDSKPEMITLPEVVSEELVPVKVTFCPKAGNAVIRRLSVPVKLDVLANPVESYGNMCHTVANAFRTDIDASKPTHLTYKDEDGDDIAISSDHELGVAMQQLALGPVLRMNLRQ